MSYERDPDGYVRVNVDGSCKNNGRNNPQGGWGVHFKDDSNLNTWGPVRGPATNNNAEIQGMTEAYRQAKNADSNFAKKATNEWMDNWKSNGWKTAKGQPVKNQVSLQECDNARNEWGGEVVFKHVKGHSGNHGNNQADRLAKQGARRYRP